jgi:hypothetical protein
MKISAQRSLRSLSRRPAASELDEQANVQLRFQIRQAPGLRSFTPSAFIPRAVGDRGVVPEK